MGRSRLSLASVLLLPADLLLLLLLLLSKLLLLLQVELLLLMGKVLWVGIVVRCLIARVVIDVSKIF